MIFAILPAGGRSTRMGRPKLLLPLGEKTIIEHVIASLQSAGIDRILAVTPPHLPELAETAARAGATVLRLSAETADMRSTVEAGLAWAETEWRPAADDAWLLVPADHPTLSAEVVRHVLAVHTHSIVVPTHAVKRGHPTLIGWRHVAGIRALPAGQGLNNYLRQHAAETLELAVEEPGVLCDLDTPEEYERLVRAGRLPS